MPNHVDNDLYVYGPTKKLNEFMAFAKASDPDGEALVTEKFIPYPDKFKEMDEEAKVFNEMRERKRLAGEDISGLEWKKDGYNSGGYEWCIENWGTKWGIYDSVLQDADGLGSDPDDCDDEAEIMYNFNSAWSPPNPVILKMSEMFPELEFDLRYFECGAAFNGTFRCQAGKVLRDESGSYFGRRGG